MTLVKIWKWLLKESTDSLSYYGLDRFVAGEPVVLYHGTTATLSHLDSNKSRKELVDQFTGSAIFLTPSKKVAWKYARSSRNKGFPPEVIDDLKAVNLLAGEFLETLVREGHAGWESFWKKHKLLKSNPSPGESELDQTKFKQLLGGLDANSLADIAKHVLGTAYSDSEEESNELFGLFSGSPSGTPDWLYQTLEDVGIHSAKYRPKVYKVTARASRVLVTDNQEEAKTAFSRGYDAFVFSGDQLVDEVPEVALSDGSQINILSVETDL